jgi:hypothetical protein
MGTSRTTRLDAYTLPDGYGEVKRSAGQEFDPLNWAPGEVGREWYCESYFSDLTFGFLGKLVWTQRFDIRADAA